MNKEIAIFKTDSETINVEVIFEDETVWLTQDQMAQIFEKAKSTINEHIKNIFTEGELEESCAIRKFGNSEFSSDVTKPKLYYNLDVIISVGYRVKSLRGTQFRQWATKRLNEYIRKGFDVEKSTLSEHLENIFSSGELSKEATVRKFRTAQTKGSLEDMQLRKIEHNKIECAKKLFNVVSTNSVKIRIMVFYLLLIMTSYYNPNSVYSILIHKS